MKKEKRKVLIIEDDEDLQAIYKLNFKEANFEVKVCDNGLVGITEIVDYKPDIVVLDLMMPEMNGYEFLKALKNNTSIDVPIVVSSNLSNDEDEQQARRAGADHYIVKSEYEGEDLVKEIVEFLDTRTVSG